MLGMGTVGSEVIRYMTENADALAARIGARIVVDVDDDFVDAR